MDKLPNKVGYLNKDNWLAGFIDVDGSFSIQHRCKHKTENGASTLNAAPACRVKPARFAQQALAVRSLHEQDKISCRLRIEQRMLDPITNVSYHSILLDISNFLGCSLLTRKQLATGREYFTITASSKKSLSIIISYLSAFPLLSSKFLDYKY